MRLTVRTRLTLIYGGLFVLAGVVLLAITYVLVQQRLPVAFAGEASLNTSPDGPAEPRFVQKIVTGIMATATTAGSIYTGVTSIWT